jgi:hypothetical protein
MTKAAPLLRLTGAAALVLAVSACSPGAAPRAQAVAGPATPSALASPSPAERSWPEAAGDVCATGSRLYPSVRLGAAADVDTVSYGLGVLADSLARLDVPQPESERVVALDLVRRSAEVAARWQDLAVAGKTTVAERAAAADAAASVLRALTEAGAQECAALVPRSS